jgi:hypothetical protein
MPIFLNANFLDVIAALGRARAFPGGILLEYGPERYFEAGEGTKAI